MYPTTPIENVREYQNIRVQRVKRERWTIIIPCEGHYLFLGNSPTTPPQTQLQRQLIALGKMLG